MGVGLPQGWPRRDGGRWGGGPGGERGEGRQRAVEPVVGALDTTFRERWTDPMPLDSENPMAYLRDRLRGSDLRPDPLPEQPADPPPCGPHHVQVLRTYPAVRPRYSFAPDGERTVARGYTKAENADLLINFKGKLEEKVDVDSTPAPMYGAGWGYRGWYGAPYGAYGYGTEVSTRRYNVGTLVMDIVDRERKQVVFQGGVEDVVTKKMLEDRETLLNNAVAGIFSKFPFRAGQSAPVVTPAE